MKKLVMFKKVKLSNDELLKLTGGLGGDGGGGGGGVSSADCINMNGAEVSNCPDCNATALGILCVWGDGDCTFTNNSGMSIIDHPC